MTERCCKNCRWWNIHSLDMKMGDCMHKVDGIHHRYSRVPMGDGSYALLDSFGPEETPPGFKCGAFDDGSTTPPFEPGVENST